MKSNIIESIKNFDIIKLKDLLDDELSYMDVSKELFIIKLEEKFDLAIKNDCHSFDDVFFGICGSCNKGCEGVTFLSNTGYYLDLYFESPDGNAVEDIYVCNKLTNFADLEKTVDLAFYCYEDEKVLFQPSIKYLEIQKEYQQALDDIKYFPSIIKLSELVNWFDRYNGFRKFVLEVDMFERFDYKLYSEAFSLIGDIDNIVTLKDSSIHASNAMIELAKANTEREKVIWLLGNLDDLDKAIYFEDLYIKDDRTLEDLYIKDDRTLVDCKSKTLNIKLDITEYEYVLDYFQFIDDLHEHLMTKYKPSEEQFMKGKNGYLEYSLGNYFRLSDKYLDLLEKYGL
ncbi:hypothetical protein [Nonlabens antarcticus]|uniref:hypothetical protein n=1 Tax=Nonlabens antarcticus TaxID=392714 RepID=UPI001891614C|nr:hypothetical protein [Nonlabens antarcticus]